MFLDCSKLIYSAQIQDFFDQPDKSVSMLQCCYHCHKLYECFGESLIKVSYQAKHYAVCCRVKNAFDRKNVLEKTG